MVLWFTKAEEPLPAFGACLLGSLNLAAFVKDGHFDWSGFKSAVRIAVKALNDVLDEGIDKHPLKEQQKTARDWRQIGLGCMGISDMLIKLKMKYGDPDSLAFCDSVAATMAREAIIASTNLAEDEGYYPNYRRLVETSSFFNAHADTNIRERVAQHGLRNSQLLTIAPTGTISTMIGVSGGIEPIFANSYNRTTKTLHGEEKTYKVYTPIVREYMESHGITDEKDLPRWFVTASDIPVHSRISMQSVWQSHVDASISSTVNLPNSATVEDVEKLYLDAWRQGLKGITVYRAGCAREGILVTDETDKRSEAPEGKREQVYDTYAPVSRKTIGVTSGKTYCRKCACGTLYITVNRDSEGHVVETFVHTSKGGICQANLNGLNRMISVGLRSGVKVEEIADQLKGITCPACIKTMGKGTRLDGISCSDILGKTLLEFYNDGEAKAAAEKESEKSEWCEKEPNRTGAECPDCGTELVHEGGCVICLKCGWSKCS